MPGIPRLDTISIIGGGWSVRHVDLDRVPGTRIGVNDSCIHARCHIVVSMDRLWTEFRWPELRAKGLPAWLRRSALKNVAWRQPWLHVFECDHETTEFSEYPDVLNGTNSGFCALNLAYQMRPLRIVLFGFDMQRGPNGDAYWHDHYPWTTKVGATSSGKYRVWSSQFESAARKCAAAGIEVINASPSSAIKTFPKTDEFLRTKERACVL